MKKNKILILGLSIPVLMIILVVASIYIPTFFVKPKYNFIYAFSNSYFGPEYKVKNSKLTKVDNSNSGYEISDSRQTPDYPTLCYYDVKKDENTEISFEEAAKKAGTSIKKHRHEI